MTLRSAQLTKLSKRDATAFVEQYEHLGNVGLGVWHWGLRIDGVLASVVSFGVPCCAPTRGFLAEKSKQVGARLLQLCRGATAFWAPRNTPSRTISLALQEIFRCFGPALVVAYADVVFSEVGTIYQSSNGIYTGLTNPKGQGNYFIKGRIVNGWIVRKRYGTRSLSRLRTIDPQTTIIPLQPKFRYVLLAGPSKFKREARRVLLPCQKPYPKRSDLGIAPMNISDMVNAQAVTPVRPEVVSSLAKV